MTFFGYKSIKLDAKLRMKKNRNCRPKHQIAILFLVSNSFLEKKKKIIAEITNQAI